MGSSRIRENLFHNIDLPALSKSTLHLYNAHTFQFDLEKNKFRFYTEASVLSTSFEWNQSDIYTSHFGFGGSGKIISLKNYHVQENFGYAGLKLGFGRMSKKRTDSDFSAQLSLNTYIQYDHLIYDNEKSHVMTEVYSQSHYNMWTGVSSYSSKTYPPDFNAHDLIRLSDYMIQVGLELKGRLGIKNYFLELSTQIGASRHYRTSLRDDFDGYDSIKQESALILVTGLKFGYRFNKKVKN